MKRLSVFMLLICSLCAFSLSGFSDRGKPCASDAVNLPILMYHNIIPDRFTPNAYEIRVGDLERDIEWLKSEGYTAITFAELLAYSDGDNLPDKPVMLTFDDGYYTVYSLLPPLLDKYLFNASVAVVGEFCDLDSQDCTPRYRCLNWDNISHLDGYDRLEVINHSYNFHKIGSRKGAGVKRGESFADYEKIFNNDINAMHNKLQGISKSVFAYPFGEYCKSSEKILKARGYRATLTCREKINKITRNPDDLYLLGRFNRSGVGKSAENLLKTFQ